MITLSPGDWIAVIFGGLALLRWATEFLGRRGEKAGEHEEDQERKIVQFRSDFVAHEREDKVKFDFIKDTLERIERRIEGLQSQMRFVAIEHFKGDSHD